MTTLREEIDTILGGRGSIQKKRRALISIGIPDHEATRVLEPLRRAEKARKNAKQLINELQTEDDVSEVEKDQDEESFGFSTAMIPFGIEIECYNVSRDSLVAKAKGIGLAVQSENYNHTDNSTHYKIVTDGSIRGYNANEVVSPIMQGERGEQSLKKLCECLNKISAKVNKSTGLHVHFDLTTIDDAHYVNIFRNYKCLEPAIDSFMPMSRRGANNTFCRTFKGCNFDDCTNKMQIATACKLTRYFKINPVSYERHNSIEFRQHSGTIEYKKMYMWISFLRRLIAFSKNNLLRNTVTDINDITFLSAEQKRYFNARKAKLNQAI